jgi:hypothetical protein
MLGLALPADHPVWTAVEEPLPVERADRVAALAVPGWLVSATSGDGVVRVINHGTDHSVPGDLRADSPLYARLGYSTATLPPLIGATVGSPSDNSVAIIDGSGRATHRNGFESLGVRVVDGQGHAVSRAQAHWVATEQDTGPDHGSGRGGAVRPGPVLTMGSIVRGAVEVRAVRVDSATGLDEHTLLEFSGWPVAGDVPPVEHTADDPVRSTVTGGGLTSSLTGLAGLTRALVHREQGTSPLAEQVAIPVLRTAGAPRVHEVYAAAVVLHGSGGSGGEALPTVTVTAHSVAVRWPDGAASRLVLPDPQAASGARRPD